ncbi:hypothetical protein F5Y19DRAFT_475577, partial [Xylariaceae sp. FL1651]
MPAPQTDPESDPEASCLGPLSCAPVEIEDFGSGFAGHNMFMTWPLLGPLLFENESSDARDHCANERMSVAIALSFHLRSAPSTLERRMARPLGLIFWLLSVACLAAGLGNYIKTVNKYGQKKAIVQSGWRTQ